jgi:hypothetical protein
MTPRHASEIVVMERGREQYAEQLVQSKSLSVNSRYQGLYASKPNTSSSGTMRSSKYSMDPMSPSRLRHTSPVRSNVSSTLSLDYSTDGSSAFLTTAMDDSSMLYGHNFATVESESVFSNISSIRQPFQQPIQQTSDTPIHRRADANECFVSELSLCRSDSDGGSSYDSVIPSDEDLFEIGWAKALDPKSGAYYYFTLDRTHTVWENPLNPLSDLGEANEF